MLFSPRKFFLFGVILVYFCAQSTQHLHHQHTHRHATEEGLCFEFQAIRNLISRRELFDIIDRHVREDLSFQRALSFLHTTEFSNIARRIETSSSYHSILRQFEQACVNTTDIATFDRIFHCLVSSDYSLPESCYPPFNNDINNDYDDDDDDDDLDDEDWDVDDFDSLRRSSRTLHSFATDVYNAFPKDRLRSLFAKEIRRNKEFGQFYKIMRDKTFQRKVIRGLSRKGMSQSIRKLRKHKIDVSKLLKMIFKLFSMGP